MSDSKRKNTGAIVRIVIWSVVLCLLIGILSTWLILRPVASSGIGFSFGWSDNFFDQSVYSIGDCDIDTPISALDIDWASGSVNVVADDQAEVLTVRETWNETSKRDEDKLRWKVDSGRLYIKFSAPRWGIVFGRTLNKQLTVTVPSAWMETPLTRLDVDAASAPVSVSGISAMRADIDTASGSIILQQLDIDGLLDIDTASGRIQVQSTTAGDVNIDSASGSVTLECDTKSLDIDIASGKVDVTLTGRTREVSIHSASGGITVRGTITDLLDTDTASGRMTAYLTEAPRKIKADSASGDVTLYLPPDIAGFTAKIDSLSGDISCPDFSVRESKHTRIYGDGSTEIDLDTASGDLIIRKNGE